MEKLIVTKDQQDTPAGHEFTRPSGCHFFGCCHRLWAPVSRKTFSLSEWQLGFSFNDSWIDPCWSFDFEPGCWRTEYQTFKEVSSQTSKVFHRWNRLHGSAHTSGRPEEFLNLWGQWLPRSGTDSRFVFSTSRAFCSSWPCAPIGLDWHAGAAWSAQHFSAAMEGGFEPWWPCHTQFVQQIPSVVDCTVFVKFARLTFRW